MSPACQALATILRRHFGQWLSHAVLYEAGKHNMTARLSELRNKYGMKIDQRGAGEKSEYRLTYDPAKPVYRTLRCDECEKDYVEPEAIAGQYCRVHGITMREVQPAQQEDLFGVPA